ncbi:MAG: VCBS repeat-containing protein, partial [Chitinophagaceae bacterium]
MLQKNIKINKVLEPDYNYRNNKLTTISYRRKLRSERLGEFISIVCIAIVLISCSKKDKDQPVLFEAIQTKETGLDFVNKLTPTADFNLFKYLYYYNGAGVGTGDFNNDGLTDIFFASNQQQNKLYLNKGNLQFKDATEASKIPQDSGWNTGISVVDINNDGLLDIYVCRVGNYDILQSRNQFLICTGINKEGIPEYEDKANEMGIDFSGFSTQAAFLDYDLDGDLDMYLLNHSLRFTGTFNERKHYLNTSDTLSGDYLFRNDFSISPNNKSKITFTDVTKSTGIFGYIIGYGLG